MTYPIVDTMAESLLEEFGDHSISLAISYMGDLIYSKGFGYINTDATIPTNIKTKYRIASVSKPITSTAIHILIERGLLSYNDLVFGTDGILSLPGLSQESLQAVQDITVDHLLLHSSGLTRSTHHTVNVPILEKPNELIEFVINKTPKLDFQPGSQYSYSNIGYILLAEIVAQVSGKAYSDFVADEIFKPLGIKSIVPGDENQFAENEVTDYQSLHNKGHQTVVSKYYQMGPNLGAGGWVATPEALLKFISAIKGHSEIKILKKDTIDKMLAIEGPDPSMARGWLVNPNGTIWHTGTLSGQSSSLIGWNNGISYSFIANRDGRQWNANLQEVTDSYGHELDAFAQKAASAVSELYFKAKPDPLDAKDITDINNDLQSQDNNEVMPVFNPLRIESHGNIYLLQGANKLAFAMYKGKDDLISIAGKRRKQYTTKYPRWQMLAIEGSENEAQILWLHKPRKSTAKLKTYSYHLVSNKRLEKILIESSGKPIEGYKVNSIGAQRLQKEFGLSDYTPGETRRGIKGSSERDRLNGTQSDDQLFGYESADRINGRGGDDLIDAGLSTEKAFDKVKGGSGSDTFVVKDGYRVLIMDFKSSQDVLDFSGIRGGYSWEQEQKFTNVYDNDGHLLVRLVSAHSRDSVDITTS